MVKYLAKSLLILFASTIVLGNTPISLAQNSALLTSGMGGGASSTARLSAVQSQQMQRLDDMETCGNKARFFGPNFSGAKDGDNCLKGITLNSSGNFGINVRNPSERLQVNGGKVYISSGGDTIGGSSLDGAWLKIGTAFGIDPNEMYFDGTNASFGILSAHDLNISTGGSARIKVLANGNVGIGGNPSAKLHVNGTLRSNNKLTVAGGGAAITGNTTFSNNVTISGNATATQYYHSSDRRLKDNIRPLENTESILSKLKPVRFNWQDDGPASIGFIAQDVEKVVPEAVVSSESGYKAMDYNMLVAPLVAAYQAQQKEIEALRKAVAKLSKERGCCN